MTNVTESRIARLITLIRAARPPSGLGRSALALTFVCCAHALSQRRAAMIAANVLCLSESLGTVPGHGAPG